MVFRNIVPPYLSTLSLEQALELATVFLENAYKIKDFNVSMVLCREAEVTLSQAKKGSKKYPSSSRGTEHRVLCDGISTAYIDLAKLLDQQGFRREAMAIRKRAEKWEGNPNGPGRLALQLSNDAPSPAEPPKDESSPSAYRKIKQRFENVKVVDNIFAENSRVIDNIFTENVRPTTAEYKFPELDERLNDTPELVRCLSLLQASFSPDDILEPVAQMWLQVTKGDADELERLHALSTGVVRVFFNDEFKDMRAVAEVVCLAPVLDKDTFHSLISEFHTGISQSSLLNFQLLEGIAQLIQEANPGCLSSDDFIKILELLSKRLMDTHQQSPDHLRKLTLAISHVLDAMADAKVTGVDRETLHEPLLNYLSGLKNKEDPFLVYQAAYAYQALLCVPDNETTWQGAIRRTGMVVKGVSGLVSAAKGFDLEKLLEGLTNIQNGLGGVSKVIDVVKTGYEGVTSLAKSGQRFLKFLEEGLSFKERREWYAALRGSDILIQSGELATFKKLVCRAPCRNDPAFQWGVCQRLGEMAANPIWDAMTRRGAIAFLGEIYRDDKMWGDHADVKQWILNILMQMDSSATPESVPQLHSIASKNLLQDLEGCKGAKKLALYQQCLKTGPIDYPLKITLPELKSPSLLDRVQDRPDVEGNIRVLRKHRTKEHGKDLYILPQAMPNFQALDEARFSLIERVRTFLESDQKVFLLLGDSGAGKSTFNRELEFELWQKYQVKTGYIPLHINLPAIEKPEYDMIAKQLRKYEFTEPQIREMKHHRRFILICDGYDESQQTHNLYVTNKLNQTGEWGAQMIVSCRSEYLGTDYRDQFQPGGDRNARSDSPLFQEAVMAPFTMDQVEDYIKQYVRFNRPLWRIEDYKQALELIPSLKELVSNPFLMTLSLDVLPRMVDPGKHLSGARVTRVTLYDHFVEQWFERGKKRLRDKDMSPQMKAAFERLSAEGFALNGIEYLKMLAVAIYKEQDGNPVIEYTQLTDERSWKVAFFKEKHKQLLLEACPLRRNGNQHRFIHRSLLEYGLARAVFDPQDRRNKGSLVPVLDRRGSTSSVLSLDDEDTSKMESSTMELEVNPNSPLVWRSFVNDHSLMQFLEERVVQEPAFRRQLRSYIELSKSDKKWRRAASNAITVLVRSGFLFNGADLRGIRIPGADLSYGSFDSAQLQDADLRRVTCRAIWMRQANLSGAQIEGAQFGELPYLSEDDKVHSCAYSPDGRSFAAGLGNGNISVYLTSSWEKVLTLVGHSTLVSCVAYSRDGSHIASTSYDYTARLWDVQSGACQHIFIHSSEVYCVTFSPRERHIVIGSNDKMLMLRDVKTGECVRILSRPVSGVFRAAYSPKGDKIATVEGVTTVCLWDIEKGTQCNTLTGHGHVVCGIAYSPCGDQIATASWDGTVRLWEVEAGACRHVLQHSTYVHSVAFSPKGDQVASGSSDGTVRIWDVETGRHRYAFTGHSSFISTIVYSSQGNHLASGSNDKTVRLWDVSSGVSRVIQSDRHNGKFKIQCSPNGEQLASYDSGNMIRLMDVNTRACKKTLGGSGAEVMSVAYSPQGDKIISCDEGGLVLLWNVEAGSSKRLHRFHSWCINPCFAFSPQGQLIASACGARTVHLWDATTGKHKEMPTGQTAGIVSVAFSPDGKMFASGSNDGTVWTMDTESFTHRRTLDCGSGVQELVFSPQGHQLASASRDGIVRLWDYATGDCQMILVSHVGEYLSIEYSLNGDTLVSVSAYDKIIHLWDVELSQCRAVIRDIPGTLQGYRAITRGINSEHILVAINTHSETTVWKIVNEEERCYLSLHWIATGEELEVTGASIQGTWGLTQLNKRLLTQRGAQGEPESHAREASDRVIAMASAVSRFMRPTARASQVN